MAGTFGWHSESGGNPSSDPLRILPLSLLHSTMMREERGKWGGGGRRTEKLPALTWRGSGEERGGGGEEKEGRRGGGGRGGGGLSSSSSSVIHLSPPFPSLLLTLSFSLYSSHYINSSLSIPILVGRRSGGDISDI